MNSLYFFLINPLNFLFCTFQYLSSFCLLILVQIVALFINNFHTNNYPLKKCTDSLITYIELKNNQDKGSKCIIHKIYCKIGIQLVVNKSDYPLSSLCSNQHLSFSTSLKNKKKSPLDHLVLLEHAWVQACPLKHKYPTRAYIPEEN